MPCTEHSGYYRVDTCGVQPCCLPEMDSVRVGHLHYIFLECSEYSFFTLEVEGKTWYEYLQSLWIGFLLKTYNIFSYVSHGTWQRVFLFSFFSHLINRPARAQETPTWPSGPELDEASWFMVKILFSNTLLFSTKYARSIVGAWLGMASKPRLSELEMSLLKY